ncbi:MAG: hypothetical protein JW863_08380, partial [Chitinispirillaceae bacterium]|nr:hypothetical protein [Chitinispirillaceae bacterium]
AVVTRVRGVVMTSYGTNGQRSLTTRGELLFNRAVLTTGETGMAQVRFIAGGSTVLIPPGSELLFSLEGTSETGRVNKGQAIFDVQAQHRGSVDMITPATILTTPSKCVSIVTHDTSTERSAIFMTSGSAMIPDPDYSNWCLFSSPSAAYVGIENPTVHTSVLTPGDTSRIDTFVKMARSMKGPPPLTHTLIIRSDTGGTVLPGDTMTALQGYAIELTARPDPGYVFLRWQVRKGTAVIGNVTACSTTVSVSSDAIIAARFTDTPATLTVETKGEGHTLPEGDAMVPRNKPWKITAHPYFGYMLKKWIVSDGVKVVFTDSTCAVVVVEDYAGSITAQFDHREFNCDVLSTPGGSVTPGKGTKVQSAFPLAVKAVPDEKFSFVRWEVISGHAVLEDPYIPATTIQCDSGDVQVRARFNKSNQTDWITINGHEWAAVVPCGTVAVPRGETVTITTKTDQGYELKNWFARVGNATIVNGTKTVVRPHTNCELFPAIVTKQFNLTVNAQGPGTTTPAGITKVFYNTHSTITATAQRDKQFASWKVVGGDATITDIFKPTTTVRLSSTDAIVAAEFVDEICTLFVDATMGGYVEPADTQIVYKGKQLGIKAVANPRAAFLGWSVESGKENIDFSDTLTVREQLLTVKKTGNINITARFTTRTVELTMLSNGLGITEPEKNVWIPQNQWIPLKATPAEGNKFLQWVTVAGTQCEIHDRFSQETEINPGTHDVTIKALFDTASGYIPPDFPSQSERGPFILTIENDRSSGKVAPKGPLTVQKGIQVQLQAEAASKYKFHEWIVRSGTAVITDRYRTETSVILSDGDATIAATFVPETTHMINVEFFGPKNQKKTIIIPYR